VKFNFFEEKTIPLVKQIIFLIHSSNSFLGFITKTKHILLITNLLNLSLLINLVVMVGEGVRDKQLNDNPIMFLFFKFWIFN